MKRMMTLLLAAVLTAALWAGTPLPVQAANEFNDVETAVFWKSKKAATD